MTSALSAARGQQTLRARMSARHLLFAAIFFASGFSALIYQVAWQRSLYAIFGINVEAVTVVVTGFLMGLGLGSLAGGRLSRSLRMHPLALFALIELAIGAFGFVSLDIFAWVGARTLGLSVAWTTLVTVGLLLVPTLLMGATLPILVSYLVRTGGNVGRSVGLLYCVNTVGSAVACFASAVVLMRAAGLQGSVTLAAAINLAVGACAALLFAAGRREAASAPLEPMTAMPAARERIGMRFSFALLFAALVGFISLSYEIVWFRAYLISTNRAPAFALVLGAFLAGLGFGAYWIRRFCIGDASGERLGIVAGILMLASSVLGFMVLPLYAHAAVTSLGATGPMLALIFVQTFISGGIFPIICHLSIRPDRFAGARVGFVYLANIVGSVAGTLITGFLLMDVLSTAQISMVLALIGSAAAIGIAKTLPIGRRQKSAILAASAIALILIPLSAPLLFANYYERIVYGRNFGAPQSSASIPVSPFVDVIENKSGVITVNRDLMVFGGGIYDGNIKIDLVDDTNVMVRAFSLSLYRANPEKVLMVGLGSGAWAHILAQHPQVRHLKIVEINPGYLELISKYPLVSGLLQNPKVEIVIDDGRRWLNKNPHEKFDVITQNTTYHFRPNVTNVLSEEYLRLAAQHLRPQGVLVINSTRSLRSMLTACTMFPHALRQDDLMIMSTSPLRLDRDRFRQVLSQYTINGRPALDLSLKTHRDRLDEIVNMMTVPPASGRSARGFMEDCGTITARAGGLRTITDDNMGEEWEFPEHPLNFISIAVRRMQYRARD